MIGKRLAKLRKNASLTQKELAKQLNLTLYAISAYENNRNEPPDSIKILFAKRFNVSIDYLLGMTEIAKHKPIQIITFLIMVDCY